MLPTVTAEFIITGTKLSPNEITNGIGLSPNRTWVIGDSIQNTVSVRKHNGWCISTKDNEDIELEDSVKQILELLLPKSEIIAKFCTENNLNCELSCVAYVTDETPSINFGKEVVSALVKLNASIDVDIILTTG